MSSLPDNLTIVCNVILMSKYYLMLSYSIYRKDIQEFITEVQSMSVNTNCVMRLKMIDICCNA